MSILFWVFEYWATFAEAYIGSIFCGIFLRDNKVKKSTRIICSLIIAVLMILVNRVSLFSYYTTALSIGIMCMLQYIVYKKQIIFLTGLTFIYMVILSVADFIIAQVVAIAFNTTSEFLLNEQSIQRVCCLFLSKIMLATMGYMIYKINKNKIEILKKYIVLICLIAFVLLSANYYVIGMNAIYNNEKFRIFAIIFFVGSFILMIAVFQLIVKMTENYKQSQDMALLELQNKMIMKASRDTEHAFNMWRSSIHDYKHKIIALKQWADVGNVEKIKSFIEKENEMMEQKLFYIKTGNGIVDAIVNTKQNLAEEKGIVFLVNAIVPQNCKIEDTDLACILGNLIDNAIEASATQEEKRIEVIIKEMKNLLIIKVINTFQGDLPFNMSTTKSNSIFHGIGIKNIQGIVEKYNGSYEIDKKDGDVIVTVMLLNK
jgi:histidine kinase-, DNA gyrase B-, and HSP90-like ATPase